MISENHRAPTRYPGFDALQEAFTEQPEEPLNYKEIDPYVRERSHLKYLENQQYHRYLKIHKVVVGNSGSEELIEIAESLSGEYMPKYLDAAASAYSEAALQSTLLSTENRLQFVDAAEALWNRAILIEAQIQSSEYSAVFTELETQYRLALSLAYVPFTRAMVEGNVTDEVREQVFNETALLGKIVTDEMTRYYEAGCKDETRALAGLSHEINALCTLLYQDDPRYIPMPSTARADSGYYHPEQTHDIMIFNQHWGTIKKVIPVEIKSRTSLRDRKRYKALLIRGKMHLATNGVDSQKTADAFYAISRDDADEQDIHDVERISTEVRYMLNLYQQGFTPESLAVNSVTRFYTSKKLNQRYPEVAAISVV